MALTYVHAQPVTVAVTAVTTAETIVGVVGPLPENVGTAAGTGIMVRAILAVTTGVGATAITVRVRLGNNVAGTLVSSSGAIVAAASTAVGVAWAAVDVLAADMTPGQEYTVTVQQTSATGNATVIGVLTAEDVQLTT